MGLSEVLSVTTDLDVETPFLGPPLLMDVTRYWVTTYLTTYIPTHLPTYWPTHLSTYLPVHLLTYLSTHLFIYLFWCLETCTPTLWVHLSPSWMTSPLRTSTTSVRLPRFRVEMTNVPNFVSVFYKLRGRSSLPRMQGRGMYNRPKSLSKDNLFHLHYHTLKSLIQISHDTQKRKRDLNKRNPF